SNLLDLNNATLINLFNQVPLTTAFGQEALEFSCSSQEETKVWRRRFDGSRGELWMILHSNKVTVSCRCAHTHVSIPDDVWYNYRILSTLTLQFNDLHSLSFYILTNKLQTLGFKVIKKIKNDSAISATDLEH
uniref:Uncharacterized protein n=1 Tax=Cynoglossus semilaevis TaxID=244447 RepID=A0A3P8WT37_CYNSE